MFAVPGWAVSAASLVEEKARAKPSDPKIAKSKKRKRNEYTEDNRALPSESNRQQKDDRPTSTRLIQAPLQTHRQSETTQASATGHRRGKLDADVERVNATGLIADDRVQGGVQSHPSKRKKEKEKRNGSVQQSSEQSGLEQKRFPKQHVSETISNQIAKLPPLSTTAKLTPLQAKMRNKLTSARFRHLNETLYTTSSSDALDLFTSSPDLFTEYHAGFSQQVKASWPQNPVDGYVQSIKTRGTLSEPQQGRIPLPRRKTGSCTVVDLGCGDAPLARGCQSVVKTLRLKFHNYDLHAPNTFVTKADVSDLPLRDGEADIAIFCLSLMGTNWVSFVEEAWRILRGDGKGEIWVAEVKSRFGRVTKGRVVENSVGKKRKTQKPRKSMGDDEYDGPEQFAEDDKALGEQDDETDVSAFVKVFTRRGFQLREGSVNKKNKMFVTMIFTKTGIPTAGRFKGLKWNGKEYQKQNDGKMRFAGGQKEGEEITPEEEAKVLKPCVYKTR